MEEVKKEEKQEASVEMMEKLIELMCEAPDSQMDKKVREKFLIFKDETHTPREMFDFLVSVSRIPITKVSEKACIGDISSFVAVTCALDNFYIRPE